MRLKRLTSLVAVLILAATACSSGGETTTEDPSVSDPATAKGAASTPSGSEREDTTLDVALTAAFNLNPVLAPNGKSYAFFAYDTLIYRDPEGNLQPRLAETWEYLDEDNQSFEVTLRPDVQFSDGSDLTADVIVANWDYQRENGIGLASRTAAYTQAEAVDDLTVRFTLDQPNPELPTLFTQDFTFFIISADALQNPDILATETAGSGQYVLDPSETVDNDHYTYTPNPTHWDPDAIHWEKVVVKVVPNYSTGLSALKTGQLDVMSGDFATAAEAEDAGLQVKYAQSNFIGLGLADRDGDLLEPLGDVRVRQALNFAVNREQIAATLVGKYGEPAEQIQVPGGDGYNEDTFYSYDPEQARQLLAEAGYPDGFTLPIVAHEGTTGLMMQAVASDLAEIGVTAELTLESDFATFFEKMQSGEFPAFGVSFGSLTVNIMGPVLFQSEGAWNPFDSTHPDLETRYRQAATAQGDERDRINQEIIGWLVEQGWFLPVVYSPLFYFARPGINGVNPSPGEPVSNPIEWRPAA